MDRTKTEQEFLDYCIKKGKGKLPIAIDLLELITDFIEVDRQKQLNIHSVVGRSGQLCHLCNKPLKEGVSIDYCTNIYCIKERA